MSPLIDGGTFVLDAPEHVPAVWGEDDHVLWSQGEPLILAGPAGVGKSTLAQRLALSRSGVAMRLQVLDLLVLPDPDRRTLYVAADRPRQVARSMRRMVKETDRPDLDYHLAVWAGPLPFDLCADPQRLAAWASEQMVGTIVLDSLYNLAGDIADPKVGVAVAQVLAETVAAGIEVVALHHPRKAQEGNKRPRKLDDLYGSTWLGACAGSVVFLYGEAGEAEVRLLHLKQPHTTVGPLRVEIDTTTGNLHRVATAEPRRDLEGEVLAFVRAKGPASKRAVREAIKARAAEVDAALTRLQDGGKVERAKGGFQTCPEGRDTLGHALSLVQGGGVSREGGEPPKGVPRRDTPRTVSRSNVSGGRATAIDPVDDPSRSGPYRVAGPGGLEPGT